jgi:hypothetical protein
MESAYQAQPSGHDKIWSILGHLSILFTPVIGIVLPLTVYLAMRNESPYLTTNAKEALNFHLSLIIYAICCIPLFFIFIGYPIFFLLWITSLILGIVAAVKAADGRCYHYPLTIPLVR